MLQLLSSLDITLPKEWHTKNKQWMNNMNENNNKLSEWELKHVGQLTFSKAFYPLIQYLSLNKAMEVRKKKYRSPN